MIRAVFFDRDGTLTHGDQGKYEEMYAYIRRVTGNEAFQGLAETFMDYHRKAVAAVGEYVTLNTLEKETEFWIKYYELVFRDFGTGLDCVEESRKLQRLFPQYALKVLYPETLEVLEYCRSGGYFMGIISDTGPSLRLSIEELGVDRFFSRYVAGAEYGTWKPDPVVFQAAIEGTDLRPDECVYVDDYVVESDGARNFGFVSFNIVRDTTKERRDRWQVSSLLDIVGYLERTRTDGH